MSNVVENTVIVIGQKLEITSIVERKWVEVAVQAQRSQPATSIVLVKLLPDYIFMC